MTLSADLNIDINTTDETLNRKRFEIVVKHILKRLYKDANVNNIIIDFEEPIQVVLQGFIDYNDIYKFKCDVANAFNVSLHDKYIHSSFTFENLYYLIKERVYIPFYNASI